MNLPRFAILASVIFLTLLLAACGGDDQDKAQDPAMILAASAKAVERVSSFHFRLNHENGATPIPLNLQLVSAEGDVVIPDRLSAEIRAKAASITVSVKVIGIGDKTWITNPFSRRWQLLPGATLKDVADPASLVTALVQGLQDIRMAGEIEVDGVKTYRLAGKLDSGALKVAVPSAEPGHPVAVDLWIAAADSLPRRARIAGRLSAAEPGDIVRQVDFSRFNAAVNIQPPE